MNTEQETLAAVQALYDQFREWRGQDIENGRFTGLIVAADRLGDDEKQAITVAQMGSPERVARLLADVAAKKGFAMSLAVAATLAAIEAGECETGCDCLGCRFLTVARAFLFKEAVAAMGTSPRPANGAASGKAH